MNFFVPPEAPPTKIKLEYVAFTEKARGVATVAYRVPVTPDSFNGYITERIENVRVVGTTAFALARMVAGWQQAYPPNSNVVRYYPPKLIEWSVEDEQVGK